MDEAKLTQLLGPESARLAIETMQRWQVVDETHVAIDRDRLNRLLDVARAWVSEGAANGEGWDAAFMRANLQPGDLDPIP